MVFEVVGRFPLVFGLVSYPPGPILKSVFLWCVSVDRNLPLTEKDGVVATLRRIISPKSAKNRLEW